MKTNNKNLSKILKQRRTMKQLTLRGLAVKAGVSKSLLSRIEKAERFPSARILRNIAEPLGFQEDELFMLAGYLDHCSNTACINGDEWYPSYCWAKQLDPYVAGTLAQEPVRVQRIALLILSVLKKVTNQRPTE
jgi:transcriptional regulator with XRE-family HTH domain